MGRKRRGEEPYPVCKELHGYRCKNRKITESCVCCGVLNSTRFVNKYGDTYPCPFFNLEKS